MVVLFRVPGDVSYFIPELSAGEVDYPFAVCLFTLNFENSEGWVLGFQFGARDEAGVDVVPERKSLEHLVVRL